MNDVADSQVPGLAGAQRPRPAGSSEWPARVNRYVDRFLRWLSRHWLASANALFVLYLGLAVAAPALKSAGFATIGQMVFLLFRPICHQLPSHSYTVFGNQMACCQRCAAIYGAFLLGGLVFVVLRKRVQPLRLKGMMLLSIPMAIDGFTQLFGLRESTWELRTMTGGLFGLACAWFVFPVFERTMSELRELLEQTRFTQAGFVPLGQPVLREG